jgi:hypothetical protein
VRFEALGSPIVCAVCYCDDCQAGARQLEALGARTAFKDTLGGAPYMTFRDDAVRCVQGEELLHGVKLRDDAPTTRFIATCCQSPMYLKYAPGWWVSMYRDRFGDDAAPVQFRSQTQHAQAALPRDIPTYRNFPPALLLRLLKARLGMLLVPMKRG